MGFLEYNFFESRDWPVLLLKLDLFQKIIGVLDCKMTESITKKEINIAHWKCILSVWI